MNNLNNTINQNDFFVTHEKLEVEEVEINEMSTKEMSFETEMTITYNGIKFKPSKKHNQLISLYELLNELKKYKSLSQYDESEKIKISRKWFNFIVADYFAVSEHIIDNLNNCKHKNTLNYILNELNNIIANNNGDDRRGFLINSNDIKNKIIKIIIQEAKYRFTEFNGVVSNLFNAFFKKLPEQLYSFPDKFKELIKILKSYNHDIIANEIENNCYKSNGLILNPWMGEIKSTVTLCRKLSEKLISEKVIFIIENIQNDEENFERIEENSDLCKSEQTTNLLDIPYIRKFCKKMGFTTSDQYVDYVGKTLFRSNTDLNLKEDGNLFEN